MTGKTWKVFTTLLIFIAILAIILKYGVSSMQDEYSNKATEGSLPGIGQYSANLSDDIIEMVKKRGESYKPRTKHLKPDGSAKYTNRLFLESSPYLLQHANNPLNWYPWGDEAFETAARLDRPVLLSVGYSTCHWCHVMEEESFDDVEIAEYLNKHYISIKVDREERPDVDAIYMAAVQGFTGRGGWPMTVWLTPERKPFYGGTYFPARDGDRGHPTGFFTLLQKIEETYHQQREEIANLTDKVVMRLQERLSPDPGSGPTLANKDIINQAIDC